MLKHVEHHDRVIAPAAGLDFSHPLLDRRSVPASNERLPEHLRMLDTIEQPYHVDSARREGLILGHAETPRTLRAALASPRLAIENVSPAVDDGLFAVKRTVGDVVRVEADVFMDGHDHIAVALLWHTGDAFIWNEVPMTPLGNDRWTANFPLERVGRHVFTIEAWRDTWSTLSYELRKKFEAGQDVSLDIAEAKTFIERTADEARTGAQLPQLSGQPSVPSAPASVETHPHIAELEALLARLNAAGSESLSSADTVSLLLESQTARLLAASERRAFVVRLPSRYPVDADRRIATFASWYELFPRSQGALSEDHHGTFDDVIARMPAIRDMGFDVLYFPPIHPIGKSNRKGRNNSLVASESDPGSPYAIGSSEGGHDAIHPQLGTFEDFARLITAATANGLEIALDFAIQCSPDHPWLREHPEWFQWRADGSLRHAENPPKKYEDIINVDFYADGGVNGPAAPALWLALRDIVLFWIKQGVRIFRVDNPHTKPLSFWQWMIAEVRGRHPDVIFLSEAFTRPKVMARLAKIGYSQSYTYFTWRESKWDLTQYLQELNAEPLREFFRPHFFVNTPDINPRFLQHSGRPGFVIRAALAGLLSGLWGMYSGFELCESAAVAGKEDYLDSEKYQIRVRSWQQPGNIVPEITLINRIRRLCPALHSHLGLKFQRADNDQILFFSKTHVATQENEADDLVLVAINVDPFNIHEAYAEFPLWEWGLPDDGEFAVEDLVTGNRWVSRGKHQTLRLDPAALPFLAWRITPNRPMSGTSNPSGTSSDA